MKKISIFLMMILASLLLIGCFDKREIIEYQSNSVHEQRMITAISKREKNAITVSNDHQRASGVVYKKEIVNNREIMYAIIDKEMIDTNSELFVYANHFSINRRKVLGYVINEYYGFALIRFEGIGNIGTSEILPSTEAKIELKKGQTVFTIGSPQVSSILGYVTTGTINQNPETYLGVEELVFYYDAATNPGNEGAGVYNLEAQLIGIHLDRIQEINGYPTSGLSRALNMNVIGPVITSYQASDFKPIAQASSMKTVSLSEQTTQIEYEETSHEEKVIQSIEQVDQTSVIVNANGYDAAGVIFKKENNVYYIATSAEHLLSTSTTAVMINGIHHAVKDMVVLEDIHLGIIRIEAIETYDVVPISTGNRVIGQTVISIGTPRNTESYNQGFTGVLSTESNHQFLINHDTPLNYGVIGGGLFNTSGKLIGINVKKEDVIDPVDNLAGEGLNYAIKAEYVLAIQEALKETDYQKNIQNYFMQASSLQLDLNTSTDHNTYSEYEAAMIETYQIAQQSSFLIKGNNGTGSGVVYKKETVSEGVYRYYIATNHHVIDNNNNFSIENETYGVLPIDDLQSSSGYDIASIRFTTTLDIPVKKINATDTKKVNHVVGQTVIAIGSPYDSTQFLNQMSVGILSKLNFYYNNVEQVSMMTDAAINPGNSGGPMFNLKGDLIGLNVAKLISVEQEETKVHAQSLGFVLNINTIGPVLNKYKEGNYAKVTITPLIGITYIAVHDYLQQGMDPTLIHGATSGIVVVGIDPLRGAFGQLKEYDVIISINGYAIEDGSSLSQIQPIEWGKSFIFTVIREVNGTFAHVSVVVVISYEGQTSF